MKPFENIILRDFQGGVLVLKNGQVVFEHCQGNADCGTNTPFTSHTTITLASLSKQFVAAAILLQIEQGSFLWMIQSTYTSHNIPKGRILRFAICCIILAVFPIISVIGLFLTRFVNMNRSTEQRLLMLSSSIGALLRNAVPLVFRNVLS